MHAEITFKYDDMHRPGVITIDELYGDNLMTISVLLRHEGDRLYWFTVQDTDSDKLMTKVRQAIDVLPSQLERYGWLKGTTGPVLTVRIQQALYTGMYGFGQVEDRFFHGLALKDVDTPLTWGTPIMKEFVCVAEL
jgi:hypothetical protein